MTPNLTGRAVIDFDPFEIDAEAQGDILTIHRVRIAIGSRWVGRVPDATILDITCEEVKRLLIGKAGGDIRAALQEHLSRHAGFLPTGAAAPHGDNSFGGGPS